MNTKSKLFLVLLLVAVYACSTNPFTGKSEIDLIGNNEIFTSSFQSYSAFLNENKVIKGTADANRVKAVGEKIKKAAEMYLKSVGQESYLDGYSWEYNLVDDASVNAWCMPGGKIVFYTGILPICKDDAGMAVVMGHEVAHALLNHGKSRMQTAMATELGGQLVGAAVGNKSAATQQAVALAYTGATQFGVTLPFSRGHETEADELGLRLMAIAGYNPENAVPFWQRMAANSEGAEPQEWMSTHPSNTTRITNLQKLIPGAKAEAAKFGVKF